MKFKKKKDELYIKAKGWFGAAIVVGIIGAFLSGLWLGGTVSAVVVGDGAMDLCFEYGLKFLKASNVSVNEALIREAVDKYGFSTGYSALFDENSPFKLSENTSAVFPQS